MTKHVTNCLQILSFFSLALTPEAYAMTLHDDTPPPQRRGHKGQKPPQNQPIIQKDNEKAFFRVNDPTLDQNGDVFFRDSHLVEPKIHQSPRF